MVAPIADLGSVTFIVGKELQVNLTPCTADACSCVQVLQFTHLDTAWATAKAPQLLQGGFAAVTDIFVYKIALLLFGHTAAR